MKTYPQLFYDRPLERGLCDCCAEHATRLVELRVSYMRGDDEVFKLCPTHYPLARALDVAQLMRLAAATKRARRDAQDAAEQRNKDRRAAACR